MVCENAVKIEVVRQFHSASNYAQNRSNFRSGEIRILDSTGKVKCTIPITEADRKL
jgi:hypothetical protein